MTHQDYIGKLERGLAQVRAGQGIVKTMEELERMAEETRFAQLRLPDPADADPHPRLLLARVSRRCSRMGGMILPWR